MLTCGLQDKAMPDNDFQRRVDGIGPHSHAEEVVGELFAEHGWRVRYPPGHPGVLRPDLLIEREEAAYAVEVKAASEGRGDRLVPLWSQAWLKAVRAASGGFAPLAVVAAPRVPRGVAERVLKFAVEYGPDAAAGVVDFAGFHLFRGAGLDDLSSGDDHELPSVGPAQREHGDIFSDLNQWMLKVLLAPEIPERLLSAPRGRYKGAADLARAANVSVMSASRLIRALRRDGYQAETGPHLRLVRRADLFRRWQSAAQRRVRELPMRWLLPGDKESDLRRLLRGESACLALFAAADALGMGFVHGIPPHVYVPRLKHGHLPSWPNVVPAADGEAQDLALRQAPARESVFRGAVEVDGCLVSDILQVWLDVAAHPSRGLEQADLIRRRVLNEIIEGGPAGA
jgi:hypothetical protein